MIPAERHERILNLLARHGAVGVAQLVHELRTSAATIRRDLDELATRRALLRTHGGARLRVADDERAYAAKLTSFLPEKRRIAAAAAAEIIGGDTVGCGGGTTTMQFAIAIRTKTLRIVTTALNIAVELAKSDTISVLVTGGELRRNSCETVGHVAERTLRDINLSVAVIGVDGLSPRGGLTTYDASEAFVNRVLIERARETWVLADRSKFGLDRPAVIAPLGAATRVFTTRDVPEPLVRAVRAAGPLLTLVR